MAKVINKILKQLTPERVKKEIEAIQKIKLPAELQKWVKEYEKVGERSCFNFLWIYLVTQVIVFPGTIRKYREPLWTTKTLIFMFNILLDDVADRVQNKDFLEKLIDIPFDDISWKNNRLSKKERKYFKFAVKLWKHIDKTIKKYPRHKEFRVFFDYDNRQYINAMRYAYLINKNHNLINKTESWLYISHGMQVFPIMDVDLMCSKFNTRNLGLLREIVWNFQKMSRIGNWVSTWEREIKDNDFTSGIWAYAIDKSIINIKELKKENEKKLINKIRKAKIENILLREWENSHKDIIKLGKKINKKEFEKDLEEFLSGIEKLLYLHLISRYHK